MRSKKLFTDRLAEHFMHIPKTKKEFWCAMCDQGPVNSDDLSTGRFFSVFGDSYDYTAKDFTGEWLPVLFAICNHCLEFDNGN